MCTDLQTVHDRNNDSKQERAKMTLIIYDFLVSWYQLYWVLTITLYRFGDIATYSLTSLSRPPLSRQPRFSSTVATGRIFFHVTYLVNLPPSRLALANWWIDNNLCKLRPMSRHSRLVVASLSVSATAPVSVCVSGTDRAWVGRWTVAHWPSVRQPLPLTIPCLKSYCQQRRWDVCDINGLWLRTGRAPITAFIHSFIQLASGCSNKEGGKTRRCRCRGVDSRFTHWCSSSCGRPVARYV